jgi:hypothetical protein
MNGPIRLRQGGNGHPFSQKFGSVSQIFVKKIKKVPCYRRRFCRSPGETSGLNVHRISPVSDTTYAVGSKSGVHLDKQPDSPPAGWKILNLFHEIVALRATIS